MKMTHKIVREITYNEFEEVMTTALHCLECGDEEEAMMADFMLQNFCKDIPSEWMLKYANDNDGLVFAESVQVH
jgi:hypothetical protein